MNLNHIVLAFTASFLVAGCATTSNVHTGDVTSGAVPVISQPMAAQGDSVQGDETPLKTPQMSQIQPFADRVSWPEFNPETATEPVYEIKSGVGDNVWIEGKGYFRGSLEDVYRDLTDAMVIGPTHMTQDIVRDEFVETPDLTSYVMHVKMKYIFSIKFDLSAALQPIYSGNEQGGWLYHSKKTAGTTFIQMINDTIVIEALENGWFKVEMQSLNEATKNKEDEARGHVEALFGYWAEASSGRGVKIVNAEANVQNVVSVSAEATGEETTSVMPDVSDEAR